MVLRSPEELNLSRLNAVLIILSYSLAMIVYVGMFGILDTDVGSRLRAGHKGLLVMAAVFDWCVRLEAFTSQMLSHKNAIRLSLPRYASVTQTDRHTHTHCEKDLGMYLIALFSPNCCFIPLNNWIKFILQTIMKTVTMLETIFQIHILVMSSLSPLLFLLLSQISMSVPMRPYAGSMRSART